MNIIDIWGFIFLSFESMLLLRVGIYSSFDKIVESHAGLCSESWGYSHGQNGQSLNIPGAYILVGDRPIKK